MSPRSALPPDLQLPVQVGEGDPATAERTPGAPGAPSRVRWPGSPWPAVVLAVLLAVIGGVAARAFWGDSGTDVRDGTTRVSAAGMAARYGIDVKLIGVTAAGGLIDFRYQVVDPDKANPIIHVRGLFPKLIVEDTGATLAMSAPPHNHKAELKLGGTYFFLLANARNAIRRGSRITLVIGDARLEHLVARS